MLDVDFVCCCIPLVNVGLYFILLEQLAVAIVAGVATIGTSTSVGALALPGFTGWLFAILCFIVAAVQIVGLIGVVQERSTVFKTYSIINTIAVLAAFACAAALTVVAGLKHQTSSVACQRKFYSNSTSSSAATVGGTSLSLTDSADEICDIFVIVDTSLMGGLWLLLAIVQGYLLFVVRLYGREQKADHGRYMSMYSTKGGFADEDIPLGHPSSDPWSTRLPDAEANGRRSTESAFGAPPATMVEGYGDRERRGDEVDGGYYDAPPMAGGYVPQQEGPHGRQPSYDDSYYQSPQHQPTYSQSQLYEVQQQSSGGHQHVRQASYEPGQPFPLHAQQTFHQQQQQQSSGQEYPHQPTARF